MIAVARWPMLVFDLPARNEENSGDPWKKSFKYYWESYHGVQVNDVAPFEWSCIRLEMPYKIIGNKTLTRTVVRTLLEHSVQFLTSTTWKDGKGFKVENIGQFLQVLWTRYILKISQILTWTPFPLILSFWFISGVVAFESKAKFSFVSTQATQTHNSNA